jgi:hypothetical protein
MTKQEYVAKLNKQADDLEKTLPQLTFETNYQCWKCGIERIREIAAWLEYNDFDKEMS